MAKLKRNYYDRGRKEKSSSKVSVGKQYYQFHQYYNLSTNKLFSSAN